MAKTRTLTFVFFLVAGVASFAFHHHAHAVSAMAHMDPKTEALFQQGFDLFVKKQYRQSTPVLLEAATAGHPRAQALLGRTYQEGLGVPVDYKQAAAWFGKAAAQGHRAAQYALGNFYFEGEGVPQDRAKAIALYLQSADQGYDQAEFILGLAYEFGWGGLPRDRRQAIRWLHKAAVHKNGQAGWIAQWLEKPDTPYFRNEVQLGKYIGAKIDRWVASFSDGGGGGSSPSGGSQPGSTPAPVCRYSSYAACNADKAGDDGARDRIERGTASRSERAWHNR